ncbi:MAG: peptidylprolyl isomerase [Mangrovibacterium sp.]
MIIGKNKMVTLTYDLRLGSLNGEVIEQTTAENPLKFIFGAGRMLPMFENYLSERKQGEDFQIELKSHEAYGERDDQALVDLPKDIFIVEGEFDSELVAVGNHVPMMTQDGQRMHGLVLEITDEIVKMDFNHPLAGENLFFTGNILEVRDASDEEIAKAMKGGCGGGCGCGDDDSCGGGCGDDCGCDDDSCGSGGCGCH